MTRLNGSTTLSSQYNATLCLRDISFFTHIYYHGRMVVIADPSIYNTLKIYYDNK